MHQEDASSFLKYELTTLCDRGNEDPTRFVNTMSGPPEYRYLTEEWVGNHLARLCV